MNKKIVLTFILLIAAILTGCNSKDDSNKNKENNDTLSVYTTVYPLMFLTEEIGGENVDVKSVYPPGSDEHTFEPSQKDLIKMAQSNLFFYIGHNLEGFVTKAKPILEKEGVEMVAVGERINLEKTDEDSHSDHEGHDHGDVDPHIWLDPILTIDMATEVKNELTKLKPDQKEYFEANYQKVVQKLQELHNEFLSTIKQGNKKEIIVSHAGYGYWETRYGLEQIAISGLSSSSEPTQKELKNIIITAKEKQINYILFEQNVQSKLSETIQKEINAEQLSLHNLSVLTENDIKENKDYFSLMEANLATLQKALQ